MNDVKDHQQVNILITFRNRIYSEIIRTQNHSSNE